MAGGKVIRSQHHHLLVLTGLKSVCLWAACSQLLHLEGVSACIGQLITLPIALEEERRSLVLFNGWVIVLSSLTDFLSFYMLSLLWLNVLWNSETPGSLKVFYRQEAGRGHANFSLKI